MTITKDSCYKTGFLGTTINDISTEIKKLNDVVAWLNIMYELACEDKTAKKEDRGIRCLEMSVGQKLLKESDYKTFPEFLILVAILNKIKVDSKKARKRLNNPKRV